MFLARAATTPADGLGVLSFRNPCFIGFRKLACVIAIRKPLQLGRLVSNSGNGRFNRLPALGPIVQPSGTAILERYAQQPSRDAAPAHTG